MQINANLEVCLNAFIQKVIFVSSHGSDRLNSVVLEIVTLLICQC